MIFMSECPGTKTRIIIAADNTDQWMLHMPQGNLKIVNKVVLRTIFKHATVVFSGCFFQACCLSVD